MLPYTQVDLDQTGCEDPNCPHEDHAVLFLVQRCHERAGLSASYDKRTGVMTLTCKECSDPVGSIKVAER